MTNDLPLYGARATDVIDAMLPESARDAMQIAEQRRVSTDPKWLQPNDQAKSATVGPGGEPAATGCQPGPVRRPAPPDGRRRRSAFTKAAILASCRRLMQGGEFRPPMVSICAGAPCAKRSGFQHFPAIEGLYLAALDKPTRDRILEQVIGADWEIALAWGDGENVADHLVRAIVRGKV